MKNLMILLIGVALSTGAFAQKCKYNVDKKDAFTGEQTNIIIHTNSGWTWSSIKRGNKLLIEMTFLHVGDIKKPMAVTDTVIVKLADGKVLYLKPSVEVMPINETKGFTSTNSSGVSKTTRTIEVTAFSPLFLVDHNTYETISKSGIKAIRITFTGKVLDFDFTTKPLSRSVDNIMENAKCILALN